MELLSSNLLQWITPVLTFLGGAGIVWALVIRALKKGFSEQNGEHLGKQIAPYIDKFLLKTGKTEEKAEQLEALLIGFLQGVLKGIIDYLQLDNVRIDAIVRSIPKKPK